MYESKFGVNWDKEMAKSGMCSSHVCVKGMVQHMEMNFDQQLEITTSNKWYFTLIQFTHDITVDSGMDGECWDLFALNKVQAWNIQYDQVTLNGSTRKCPSQHTQSRCL